LINEDGGVPLDGTSVMTRILATKLTRGNRPCRHMQS
jgi:hypothetical protein